LLDWSRLRPAPDARSSFEELCCQLAAREAMPEGSTFTRLDPPDGGVECFWRLPDGTEAGWQAKFFVNGVKGAQKRQIDESIARARRTHPRMARYVICLPVNRRQPAGDPPEFRDKWAGWTKTWKEETKMDVEFWGSAEIEERLGREAHAGRRRYFFDDGYLDAGWFNANLSAAIERAKPRYVPATNVDLPVSFAFDCLCRTPRFREALLGTAQRISVHYLRASTRGARAHAAADLDDLGKEINAITTALRAQGSPACRIDYRAIGRSAGNAQELAQKITDTLAATRGEAAGGKEIPSSSSRQFGSEAYHMGKLGHLLAELHDRIQSGEYASANTKALVVRGDAGAGKTHLFCDVAERRNRAGLPTILLHGLDFAEGDPLLRIKAILELDTAMSEFLSALDAAGEACGSRALILVDALNEGSGPSVWRRHLAGLLDLAGRYPWIAVAVSVRTTYESLVIPEHIIPDKAASITHAGFGSMTDKALQVFFDANNIDRPSMPILAPEFSNPLFLTILCKGLKNKGMMRIPDGEFTLMSVYNLYIESINERLSSPDRLDRPAEDHLVDKAIDAIAGLMINNGSWRVDYMAAREQLGRIHPEERESKSLLNLLVREGVLGVDFTGAKAEQGRTVRFAYERLAENLVIRSVLRNSTVDDLPRLLADGGKPAKSLKTIWSDRGMIDALSIQIPEKFDKELIEVVPNAATAALRESFLASLAWRSASSVGPRAVAAMDKCMGRGHEPHGAFRSLLAVSAVPRHPLNAEYLDDRLRRLTMAERDSTWSIFLDFDYYEDDSAVRRLIAWARGADKAEARREVIELAGVALAWFLTCHNRIIRDGATKALVSLLSGHADVMIRILARFAGCNDPYVAERLYCAAYGCAMYARSPGDLEKLARHAYGAVFEGGNPPADIMLREYARLIIDEAQRRSAGLDMDLGKCSPPHSSEWIGEFPGQDQVNKLKNECTGKGLPRGGSRLFASLGTLGDFYTYVINKGMGMSGWSDVPLLPGRLPRITALAKLDRQMTPEQKPHWANLLRLLDWKAERGEEAASAPGGQTAPRVFDLEQAAKSQAEKLRTLLSPNQRASLDGALSWFDLPERTDRPFDARFDPRSIARWIAVRVLELGWRSDLFGEHDGTMARHPRFPLGAGRERVGKKYQWIAYHELLARLCDNYEFKGEPPRRRLGAYLSARQLLRCRDIDPSLLPSGPFPCPGPRGSHDAPYIAYRHDWEEQLDDAEWVCSRKNLPDIGKMVSVAGSDGAEWLVLGTFFDLERKIPHDQEIHTKPYRSLDFYMDSFLVKDTDAAVLAERWSSPGSWNNDAYDNAPYPPTFIGEVYGRGRPRAPAFSWKEIPVGPKHGPVMACQNVHIFSSSFGEFDYSATNFDLSIPSRPLVHGMRLRHDGRGEFHDEDGRVVARDPHFAECGPSALLFRRDAMDGFLQAGGYGIVWRAIARKSMFAGFSVPDDEWQGELAMHAACSLANGVITSKASTVVRGGGSQEK